MDDEKKELIQKGIGVLIFATIVYITFKHDGWVKILQFVVESCVFLFQCVVITGIALFVVWLSQGVRSMSWFDKHGAGEEMDIIRRRSGGANAQVGDAIAVAIQYAGTTILVAVVLLGFFLIHG